MSAIRLDGPQRRAAHASLSVPRVGEGNGVQTALTAAEARDPEQHQTRVILATCRLLRWAQRADVPCPRPQDRREGPGPVWPPQNPCLFLHERILETRIFPAFAFERMIPLTLPLTCGSIPTPSPTGS